MFPINKPPAVHTKELFGVEYLYSQTGTCSTFSPKDDDFEEQDDEGFEEGDVEAFQSAEETSVMTKPHSGSEDESEEVYTSICTQHLVDQVLAFTGRGYRE